MTFWEFIFEEAVMAAIVVFTVIIWIILFPFLFWNKNYWKWFGNMVRSMIGAEHKLK